MTLYSAFGVNGNGATGPGSSTSYTGAFVAGVAFKVTTSGNYLNGYYLWRSDSSQSASASFALWTITGATTGTFIAGSNVSTSALATGTWNYVPLATQLALTSGTSYEAVYGLTNNFNDTQDQFGTGGAYVNGVTKGPLTVFSDIVARGGTNAEPNGTGQGVFGTTGSDPTTNYPTNTDVESNFWIDIQIGPAATSPTPPLFPVPAAHVAVQAGRSGRMGAGHSR